MRRREDAGASLKFVCVDPPLVKKRIYCIRFCKITLALCFVSLLLPRNINVMSQTQSYQPVRSTHYKYWTLIQSARSMLFVCNAAHAIQSSRLLSQIDNRFFHYRPMWFGSITNKLFLIFQGADNVCFFSDTIDCDR